MFIFNKVQIKDKFEFPSFTVWALQDNVDNRKRN